MGYQTLLVKPEELTGGDKAILPTLARLFSGPVLRQISEKGVSSFVNGVFRQAVPGCFDSKASYLSVIEDVFHLLKNHYRSDYVYRTAIANKIFLGRHSPATTTLLPELRVYKSRADLVMVNGTTTAYEIKSDLDSTERLETQLADYLKMFDKVYVVASDALAHKVERVLPEAVGLITLTPRYTLKTQKEAVSNVDHLEIKTITDSIRVADLKKMVKELHGFVPEVPNTLMFRECERLLEQCSPADVHKEMVKVLKSRVSYTFDSFHCIPKHLVAGFIESKVKPKQWHRVTELMASSTIMDFMEEKCQFTFPTSEQSSMNF